jgi:hypothetical protein
MADQSPEQKRSRAHLIRRHASSYPVPVRGTLLQIADELEAEAARDANGDALAQAIQIPAVGA